MHNTGDYTLSSIETDGLKALIMDIRAEELLTHKTSMKMHQSWGWLEQLEA